MLCAWFCVFLFALAAPLCVQAKSVVSVHGAQLPTLETTEPLLAIAVVNGEPLAISKHKAWHLDAAHKTWARLSWPAALDDASVMEVVKGEMQTWVLLAKSGTHVVTGVARVRVHDDQFNLQLLAPLPEALDGARGGWANGTLSVAGVGKDGVTRMLQIGTDTEGPHWTTIEGWPGTSAPTTLVSIFSNVFVTVPDASGGTQQLLGWAADTGWTQRSNVPGQLVPGSGYALGQANALYLVRDRSRRGAAAKLMTFQTITEAWATLPDVTVPAVDLTAVWTDGMFWAHVDADGRHVHFGYAQVQRTRLMLKWLDWLAICVYMAVLLGMGWYFYLRQKGGNTVGFFVGGRSIPFWAAGISLYATNTSSISFLAIPAKAFATNWQYLTNDLMAIMGLMFVAVWVVPVLRRLKLMSVFSYLQTRFHSLIRMMASALAIAMQMGSRMSVILFLPSLAIATITGIDAVWSILIVGGLTIVYTTLGGMKAVIWTDFLQVFVMLGSILFSIGFIIEHIHGGMPAFIATAMENHKTHLLDFNFNLTHATVWGFMFLVLFDVVLTFPKDQTLMQRVLSTKTDKQAGRSIWVMLLIMPASALFYLTGTALYVYYKTHPGHMNPTLSVDATFPLFIAAELPMGVTGLIIAGIFAASMSTLSSIINSVSTLATVDFYEKIVKNPTQKQSVRFAEISGIAAGLVGIGLAIILSRYDIESMFDVSIELGGLLGGSFGGAYTLGMFTRRANTPGVAIGIVSSICLTFFAWSIDLVQVYFYLGISILSCIVIGYLASLFFTAPSAQALKGLTVYEDR